MARFLYEIGDEVQDQVSGFKGIVVVRAQYFSGVNRYGLRSCDLKKGDGLPGIEWLDEGDILSTEEKLSEVNDGI